MDNNQSDETFSARVEKLYYYPVKGMSPQVLDQVELTPGETFPFDRIYAIENGHGRFDKANPQHLPKINFLMLMRHERLALLQSEFNPDDHMLTIRRDGKKVCGGDLTTPIGRQMIEQFFASFMAQEITGAPHIVSAHSEGGWHSFSDIADKCVHIVNLATIREIGRAMGRELDPLRFRANIYVDGLPPWSEFQLVGQNLNGPNSAFEIFTKTERCAATNVDPVSAARDMAIPAELMRRYGHNHIGVYAKISREGRLAVGDKLIPSQGETKSSAEQMPFA